MNTELGITVNCKLEISKDTAEMCLRLASMYAEDNGLSIVETYRQDGNVRWEFIGGDENAN